MTAVAENVWGSAWSPDGKRIAFSKQTGSASSAQDIWAIDVDEPLSAPLQLVTGGNGPAWSADGTHVLYNGGCGISRVPSDGSGASEDVVCNAGYASVNYATSRLFYAVNYSDIRSVAIDASGVPQADTDVTVATGLGAITGPAMVQPAALADGDSLIFLRIGTGPNLASILYSLSGVLDILSGATLPPSALSDPRISVLVNAGTFINTGYPSLTGELLYFCDGPVITANLLGDGLSGAMFPGEDVGTDGLPLDPTDENSDLILDQPSAGENNGVLDAGEDLGLDAAPLDPFDNGSGEPSMISDNDGITSEPSIGEGNGVLDEAPATRLHTVVVRFDGSEPPQVLAEGFSVGVSPDGTRLSYLKRTWEGPLGISKPFLNFDLFVGSVRATCPINAAAGGSMKDGSGTTLTVAPGALVSDTDITIETPPVDLVPTTPLPLALARIYGPSGLTFDPPATIDFHYTDAQITGFEESSLSLNIYNSTTEQWEPLTTAVDVDANLLSAEVPHFSPVVVWGVSSCGNGTPDPNEGCDDGNTESGDGCDANCTETACGNGIVTSGEVCDDGNVTNGDCCSSTCQLPGPCFVAPSTKLQIKDSATRGKDQLKWHWGKGDAFAQTDLGTPDVALSTGYTLCVYDTTATVPSLEASIDIAPSTTRWTSKAPKGLQYKDKAGTSDGVTKVQMKTGIAGKTKVKVFAGGLNLVLPGPATATTFFNQTPNVTVLLVASAGECWTSEFEAIDTKTNEAGKFQAQTK